MWSVDGSDWLSFTLIILHARAHKASSRLKCLFQKGKVCNPQLWAETVKPALREVQIDCWSVEKHPEVVWNSQYVFSIWIIEVGISIKIKAPPSVISFA